MSIESLAKKISESPEWSKEFDKAETEGEVAVAVLQASIALGEGDITTKEVASFMQKLVDTSDDQELDDAALEAAAGGGWLRRAVRWSEGASRTVGRWVW